MSRRGETDIWYKTIKVDRKMRLAYTLAPNAARLHPLSLGFDVITVTAAAARPDPLNPKRYRVDPESLDAPGYRGNSVLEMPDAPPQPCVAQRPGVPAGRVEKRRFKSAALKNEREMVETGAYTCRVGPFRSRATGTRDVSRQRPTNCRTSRWRHDLPRSLRLCVQALPSRMPVKPAPLPSLNDPRPRRPIPSVTCLDRNAKLLQPNNRLC
jgi:hypothetical protein